MLENVLPCAAKTQIPLVHVEEKLGKRFVCPDRTNKLSAADAIVVSVSLSGLFLRDGEFGWSGSKIPCDLLEMELSSRLFILDGFSSLLPFMGLHCGG
jgi:hypothetical protein